MDLVSTLCIDKGIPLGDVSDDLEGLPRPLGSSHDIGAYEYSPAPLLSYRLFLPSILVSP